MNPGKAQTAPQAPLRPNIRSDHQVKMAVTKESSVRRSGGLRRSIFLRLGKKESASKPSSREEAVSPRFSRFCQLPDEVQLHILSFVATGPFSGISKRDASVGESTLTKTLPLVSSKFHRHCHANSLWASALCNVIEKNDQWKWATQRLFDIDPQAGKVGSPRNLHLLQASKKVPYHAMYEVILRKGLRVTAPVFISLENKSYSRYDIILDEPRYRLMMTKLIDEENQRRRTTGIRAPLCFLHVTDGRLASATDIGSVRAHLVQVSSYRIKENLDVHVSVQKVADLRLESCSVVPQCRGLYRAQALRLKDHKPTDVAASHQNSRRSVDRGCIVREDSRRLVM